jgi:(p)ppGpp synthase/HD superfamily hydrolase
VGRRWVPRFVANRPLTRSALAYAERWHAGQCRTDGTPYFDHSLEVAALLYDAGAPDHLVAAGLMHDVVEKTDATAADLHARFGEEIAGLVLAVSDDDRISSYARRKAALRRQVAGAGDEALSLFAADKLSKVRELRGEMTTRRRRQAGGAPREPRARRMKHYQRSLALLEERLPESPLVHDLRDELNACLRERAVVAQRG